MDMDRNYCVKLNDGNRIPVLGFGTYASSPDEKMKSEEITKVAIEAGFRHFDGALVYRNERAVGQAFRAKMADGTVKREDIFYTGKPREEFLPMDGNKKLIPDHVDLRTTWEALEACKDAGLVRSIGVSNFSRKLLETILTKPGLKYKPVCNQVECHPYLNQSKLLEFCKANDIVLVAYSALGSQRNKLWICQNTPVLLEDPVLGAIAKKHNRTPALVALRYQLQRGVVVLAKSFNEKRIKENMQVFDFQLDPEDMETLDRLNRNLCYLNEDFHRAFRQVMTGATAIVPGPWPCLPQRLDGFLDRIHHPYGAVLF
ncbi:aldo-keto reductase family 1 member C15-like isoform X4 [Ornithorhynchus anatinus]|uniref:aldo-keto reductase family 1 member C15-like isoform X4 n=1 Tax=Ornithorhynchus anatinus TaxID=9258 RepID=UPI0019D41CF6|nr:aldo-keto reductase family 1 member C15-like isoform X4 [Ornithorhynchus anatinus]